MRCCDLCPPRDFLSLSLIHVSLQSIIISLLFSLIVFSSSVLTMLLPVPSLLQAQSCPVFPLPLTWDLRFPVLIRARQNQSVLEPMKCTNKDLNTKVCNLWQSASFSSVICMCLLYGKGDNLGTCCSLTQPATKHHTAAPSPLRPPSAMARRTEKEENSWVEIRTV